MSCSGPGATHHLACDCRERKWAERLAGADRALYAERERVVRAELRAASLSQELLAARMARDCERKAREEADAYAGRANARIADLGERLDATEAVLRAAESRAARLAEALRESQETLALVLWAHTRGRVTVFDHHRVTLPIPWEIVTYLDVDTRATVIGARAAIAAEEGK